MGNHDAEAQARLAEPRSSKSVHTPGPWAISDLRSVDGEFLVVAGDGHDHGLVAAVTEGADARLIAAAPDLLAVLPDLLDHYLNCYDGNADDLTTRARAALTKAGAA